MSERKRHAKLPGRARVLQVKTAGGYFVTIPKELADDLRWCPGDVLEFVRRGRHVELHKREGGPSPRGTSRRESGRTTKTTP